MKRTASSVMALLLASGAFGETLVGPEEFQTLSEGKTLYFTRDGVNFGAEQFYKNRTSTWQYEDGTCIVGQWYPDADALCFVYDQQPIPQCWYMVRRDGSIYARLRELATGDPSELLLSHTDTNPVPCPAPDLGV